MADIKTALKDLNAKMQKNLEPKSTEIKKMIKTMEAARATAKTPKA